MASNADKVMAIVRERCEIVLAAGATGGFGAEQASRCRLGEIELQGVELVGENETAPKRGAKAKVTVEIDVDDSMCNLSGNAHGGFICWLIDHCSSLSLIALSTETSWVTSGVSSNITTFFIAAAPLGMGIRVVTNCIQQGKRVGVLESRVEDRETGKLLVLGVHTKNEVPNLYGNPWKSMTNSKL